MPTRWSENQTISEDIAPRRCGIAVLSVMLQRWRSVARGVLREGCCVRGVARGMLREGCCVRGVACDVACDVACAVACDVACDVALG